MHCAGYPVASWFDTQQVSVIFRKISLLISIILNYYCYPHLLQMLKFLSSPFCSHHYHCNFNSAFIFYMKQFITFYRISRGFEPETSLQFSLQCHLKHENKLCDRETEEQMHSGICFLFQALGFFRVQGKILFVFQLQFASSIF